MGTAGQLQVQRAYTWTAKAKALIEVYEQVLPQSIATAQADSNWVSKGVLR
jgi:hypothetical protein